MKCWNIISFTSEPQSTTKNPTTLVPFKTLVQTLPLAILYLLYMVCIWCCFPADVTITSTILMHTYVFCCKLVTMESVRVINVPMYTILRRTTVAFTMVMEYFLTGQKHSYSVVGRYSVLSLVMVSLILCQQWNDYLLF